MCNCRIQTKQVLLPDEPDFMTDLRNSKTGRPGDTFELCLQSYCR